MPHLWSTSTGSEHYLDKQFHQVPEAGSSWPLPCTTDDDTEEAAGEAQVTAGVGVQLLRVPPHLTWREVPGIRVCMSTDKPAPATAKSVFTFEGGIVTPEGGDKVSEQTQQNKAVPCVSLVQIRSKSVREGGWDAAL